MEFAKGGWVPAPEDAELPDEFKKLHPDECVMGPKSPHVCIRPDHSNKHNSIYHIGRSWTGSAIEDNCSCLKADCGLVLIGLGGDYCEQHHPMSGKTIRQVHRAENCPAEGAE